MTASRREARERALGLLYEAETRDLSPAEVLEGLNVAPDAYVTVLVLGVDEYQEDIDGLIRQFAKDWKLERMPAIDRALLRIAIYEMMWQPDVPTPAIISEGVALATEYSTDESGRFVNGMLSRIATEVRPSN